jgi:predicted nucleotidyltransferase
MSRLTWKVVDGKVRFDGRTLAEWVPDIVAAIVERFDPLQIILYGSVARGDDGPDSDIDLLVVLPEIAERYWETEAQLSSVATIGPATDVLIATPQEIADRRDVPGSSVYWPLREGRVVYERAV